MNKKLLLTAVLASLSSVSYAEGIDLSSLNPVVVSATRTEINSFDAPAAVDVIDRETIQDSGWGMVLSDSLKRVSGVTALSRNQYAQDPVISSRGFGARSTFGVSGIRLYVDKIPFTMPDGIGQPGNIDFGMVESIEVLKGPFSSMYGNGSGGVVAMKTLAPPKETEIGGSFAVGSYGTTKESARLAGTINDIGYVFNESVFNTGGYRANSAAHKKQSTAEITFDLLNDTHVTILADYMKMHAQDPLGLAGQGSDSKVNGTYVSNFKTYANYIPDVRVNPTAAPSAATKANTRVDRENTQIGIDLEHIIDDNNTIDLVFYGGHRNNNQFLSTSASTASGKDSTISRDFVGLDLSWRNIGKVFDKDYRFVSGVAYSYMSDSRKDIGASGGVVNTTVPNRLEVDNSFNLDEYVQGQLALSNSLDFHAGVRNVFAMSIFNPLKQTGFTNKVAYTPIHFNNTTPSLGLVWKASEATNFYADYGKGFQTPNSIQMAYSSSPGSGSGPNSSLAGSTSDNFEIGVKSFLNETTRVNAAFFRVVTSNEIAIKTGGSYTVYQNIAADTSRNGFEASVDSQLPKNFNLYGAYTYMNAKFDGAFNTSSGFTNNPILPVSAGNKIPGIFKNQLYGELSWQYPSLGLRTAFETIVNSKQYANDFNTAYANGYAISNLKLNFDQKLGNWKLSEFGRIENIFDRNYVSTVRINDSNGEYYEAGAGRNYMAGVSATYQF